MSIRRLWRRRRDTREMVRRAEAARERIIVSLSMDTRAFAAEMRSSADWFAESQSDIRYLSRIYRERVAGRAYVTAGAARVRRELGLPEVPRG